MSYTQDLIINEDDLATEWVEQPTKYMNYSEKRASAQQNKSMIKEELDVLKAQMERKIRSGEIDIGKITEGAIKAALTEDREVQTKERELIQATYEASVMDGVVESFQHRKKALEKLADMAIFGITADPKGGRVDRVREIKKQRRSQEDIED